MMERSSRKVRGFTLIELMIVVGIMGLMTPVVFRLYHEGVQKRFTHLRESSGFLSGTQTLFKYLERDLRHTDSVVISFGELKTDNNTLIMKAISPTERIRLLKGAGDLARDAPDKGSDCVIVYRLGSLRDIIREVHHGRIMLASSIRTPPGSVKGPGVDIVYGKEGESGLVFVSQSFSRTALLGDVEALEFTYSRNRLEEASWVRLSVSRAPRSGEVRPIGAYYRIFDIG